MGKLLIINTNSWKNMGNKEITQISTGLTFTNNLKMLILNLARYLYTFII